MVIGTLNESPLHSSLKDYYLSENARREFPIGKYIVDIYSDGVIYEIQTGSFSGLSKKLSELLYENTVVLVHPIANCSIIAKHFDLDNNEKITYRRSPKKGEFIDIINELIYIPKLLNHPMFSVEIVLIEEKINRIYDSKIRRRRGGWRTINRELTNIIDIKRIHSLQDMLNFITIELPSSFDTKQLSIAMGGKSLSLAQKFAYFLREANAIKIIGKKGRSNIYKKVI